MRTGMNMLLWTPFVTEEYFHVFDTLKATGFDGVEIPLFMGEVEHYQGVGRALGNAGLASTVVTVIPDEGHSPIGPDAQQRQGAVDYLKWVLDCSEALGADVVCGPFYQPLGVFSGQGPSADEIDRVVEVFRTVAGLAQAAHIQLAVEPLNRFECYFLNRLEDAATLARKVDHPHFGIMYDTFHGNIEQRDPVGCIRENMDLIKHIHISENDRGTPGRGNVPWAETFRALRSGGYDGWLTIEAFGRDMPELAATTKVWRDLSASQEECYGEGYALIEEGWAAAG